MVQHNCDNFGNCIRLGRMLLNVHLQISSELQYKSIDWVFTNSFFYKEHNFHNVNYKITKWNGRLDDYT